MNGIENIENKEENKEDNKTSTTTFNWNDSDKTVKVGKKDRKWFNRRSEEHTSERQ